MVLPRVTRQAAALRACLEASRLVVREVEFVDADPERGRWVAVGLAAAVQAALVAALSGYDTSRPEDVLGTGATDHYAPVMYLLRRARSSAYLAPPEQLRISASEEKAILDVVERRNAALHGSTLPDPQSALEHMPACLKVLCHLILDHPAFDVGAHAVVVACLKDELNRLSDLATGTS